MLVTQKVLTYLGMPCKYPCSQSAIIKIRFHVKVALGYYIYITFLGYSSLNILNRCEEPINIRV